MHVWLGPDDHTDEIQSLLLIYILTAQARPCIRSLSSFHTSVSFVRVLQQDIEVVPLLRNKSPDISIWTNMVQVKNTIGSMTNFVDYILKEWIFEDGQSQSVHIVGARFICFIRKTVGIGETTSCHLEFNCLLIHPLDKGPNTYFRKLNVEWVLFQQFFQFNCTCSGWLHQKKLAKVFGQHHRGIVSTWQHQTDE